MFLITYEYGVGVIYFYAEIQSLTLVVFLLAPNLDGGINLMCDSIHLIWIEG